ncbi:hypothetical protein Tco_0855770 [Tanacetum coccineum]
MTSLTFVDGFHFELIKEYLVKVNKRHAFWSLNEDILKITILKTNTLYSSRRYSVSVPELIKDHEGNKPIHRIQKKAIRRIKDIVCEDSGRYQAWSLPKKPQYVIIIIRSSRLKKELQEIMADSIYEEMEKAPNETIISITSNDITIELSKEFLVKLQKNTYHGSLNEDVVEHIAKVLEMVELIYAPDGKITTWEGLVEKFFCRFYPESYDGEDEMLDEGEDWGIDPLEFLSNINTSFKNHKKINGRTKKGLFHSWMNGN